MCARVESLPPGVSVIKNGKHAVPTDHRPPELKLRIMLVRKPGEANVMRAERVVRRNCEITLRPHSPEDPTVALAVSVIELHKPVLIPHRDHEVPIPG